MNMQTRTFPTWELARDWADAHIAPLTGPNADGTIIPNAPEILALKLDDSFNASVYDDSTCNVMVHSPLSPCVYHR
jgi:hypothetical protein